MFFDSLVQHDKVGWIHNEEESPVFYDKGFINSVSNHYMLIVIKSDYWEHIHLTLPCEEIDARIVMHDVINYLPESEIPHLCQQVIHVWDKLGCITHIISRFIGKIPTI